MAPSPVPELDAVVKSISAGHHQNCAITLSGDVLCWRNLEEAQVPVQISGFDSSVQSISVGGDHACAVTSKGGLLCWGDNYWGQVGDGTTEYGGNVPKQVVGMASGVVEVSCGRNHTCALTDAGKVTCWGQNEHGQLGDGTLDVRHVPTPVSGLGPDVATIAAGDVHSCAIVSPATAMCWGANWDGQLGNGETSFNSQLVPVEVSGL